MTENECKIHYKVGKVKTKRGQKKKTHTNITKCQDNTNVDGKCDTINKKCPFF